jgi:hypothetical protein
MILDCILIRDQYGILAHRVRIIREFQAVSLRDLGRMSTGFGDGLDRNCACDRPDPALGLVEV